jgi:hypothetical protein
MTIKNYHVLYHYKLNLNLALDSLPTCVQSVPITTNVWSYNPT